MKARAIGARNISVSWNDPVYEGNGLDGYEVEYEAKGISDKKPVDFGHHRIVLSGLSPYTLYTIKVSAKSFGGNGPPSEPIQAITFEASKCTVCNIEISIF